MEASETTSTSNGTSTQSPWAAQQATSAGTSAHPEYPVVGALVAGFVFAKLLGALGGGSDD